MKDIYEYFLDNKFESEKDNSLRKYLTDDIYVKIVAESGNWIESGDIYIYLFSNPFGLAMTHLFEHQPHQAREYLSRKLTKDKEGCLGMVLCGVDIHSEIIEDSSLEISDYSISIREFVESLGNLTTNEDVFNDLYGGVLKNIFVLIEGMWVYLYFNLILGYSQENTLRELENNTNLNRVKDTWRLKKELDITAVKMFSDSLESI